MTQINFSFFRSEDLEGENVSDNIDHLYDVAVNHWLSERDPVKSRDYYSRQVFPLTCQRLLKARSDVSPLELLFVPVGTQPYAPTLAILGNPATCVALLETEGSYPYGQAIAEAFERSRSGTSPHFLHVRVSDIDTADIASHMRAVFNSRGLPSRVGADITGGRKPMSAAVAGVGSLYNWRLFYVEGNFSRDHQGLSHHESIVEVSNVLQIFGNRQRQTALELLRNRAYGAAIMHIKDFIKESAASELDRDILKLSDTLNSFFNAELSIFTKKIKKNNALIPLSDPLKHWCEMLGKTQLDPIAHAAWYFAVAQERSFTGDRLGAEAALSQSEGILAIPSAQEQTLSTRKATVKKRVRQWVPAMQALEAWRMEMINHLQARSY